MRHHLCVGVGKFSRERSEIEFMHFAYCPRAVRASRPTGFWMDHASTQHEEEKMESFPVFVHYLDKYDRKGGRQPCFDMIQHYVDGINTSYPLQLHYTWNV